jgi:phosphoglycolate phosphatase
VGLPEEVIQRIFIETIEEDSRLIREQGGELYPGVREGLQELSRKLPLFVISNCQSGYIENFLDFCGFTALFKDFECWGNTRKSKSENLKMLIERNNLKNPLAVGDAEGGQKSAQICGVPFAYMEYGFGKCANTDYRFKTFAELKDFFLKT